MLAVARAGNLEMALGHYDNALRRITEAREMAERLDNTWLAAWPRVQLSNLAAAQDRRSAGAAAP